MTDLEILKNVTDTLDNIDVPTKYTEKIAIPISNCSNLLKALSRAVTDALSRKAEEEAAETEENPQEEEPEEEAEN